MAGLGATPFMTAQDFLHAAQDLMPWGAIWPRDTGAFQARVLAGIADDMARVHARAADLSERESNPELTTELLADWERAYGLPDTCTAPLSTVQQRRLALLFRIAERGGQSPGYYVSVALRMGYVITIEEPKPVRIGDPIGGPMYGEEWAYAWIVHASPTHVFFARIGESQVGDPLRAWSNAELECRLRQIAPAHTVLIFDYSE